MKVGMKKGLRDIISKNRNGGDEVILMERERTSNQGSSSSRLAFLTLLSVSESGSADCEYL